MNDRLARRLALLTPFLLLLELTSASAEEGMYPISELSRLDLRARGIELTAGQLFNVDPNRTSLVDGICRVGGCTGSFVSGGGLIITNHHCAHSAIQKASTAERDLLQNGFLAHARQDEIPAPEYQVRITERYMDVSDLVLEAVRPGMTFLERTLAIERRGKELEVQAEAEHPGLRAEVAEMFAGKTYVLFLYTYLKDVRLVFAPPQSVGNFGGDVDNWEWPRHTGDFSFMRAYTAPDGSSASYAEDNVPYRPRRFIQVAPQGVTEGDTVFLLGYPGRTARHKTASFLSYEQDMRLPTVVDLYQWQIEVLTETARTDRAVAIKHASRMRGLANAEKRSRGQLKGLRRAHIVEKRHAQEKSLQLFIDSDPSRQARFGSLLTDIAGVYREMALAGPLELTLDQLRKAPWSFYTGFFVVDAVHERQKPDLEREEPYMERNYEESLQRLMSSMQDQHPPTDRQLLAGLLRRLEGIDGADRLQGLDEVLRPSGQIEGRAADLIDGTRLGDPEFVRECLDQSPEQLKKLNDPLLNLVMDMYPVYLRIRERDKGRDGQLGRLYGSLMEIKQQFLATEFVPDANATLRMTVGRIRGYSPEDAVFKSPITTLSGLIDKTTGRDPFEMPEAVLQAYRERRFGPFWNEALKDVPVGILYDTDTTGGNSGSPVLNGRGELVGVNFDRAFEATINDFAWNESYSRSIGVDIRYVLWITGVVYGADALLAEMGVSLESRP
jgi:hypothetical protein